MSKSNLIISDFSKYSYELIKIIEPLKIDGLACFCYLEKDVNNFRFNLSTSPDWFNEYYKYKLYVNSPLEYNIDTYITGFFIPLRKQYLVLDNYLMERYKVEFEIMFINRMINVIEFYCFAGTHQNSFKLINFFLNSQEFIKKFPIYFHTKANKLLYAAKKEKFFFQASNNNNLELAFNQELLSSHNVLNNPILISAKDLLTNRENLVLTHMLAGKTAKEIAKILEISYRTIEAHISNIQLKLHCRNKSEVLIKCLIK